MFERFTERARQVTVYAREEARTLGHDHVTTVHLLLGLIREEEGLAARVLRDLGVKLDTTRLLIPSGRDAPSADAELPFNPNGKRALEHALREALGLGHNYIGTEHILLALTRDASAVSLIAEQTGGAWDLAETRVRDAVLQRLTGGTTRARTEGEKYAQEQQERDRLAMLATRAIMLGRAARDLYQQPGRKTAIGVLEEIKLTADAAKRVAEER